MKKQEQLKATSAGNVSVLALLILLIGSPVMAQSDSMTVPPRHRNNTIKLNITSWLLYDNSIQFSYERVLSRNQSLNVFGGYNEFPKLIDIDLPEKFGLASGGKRSGYSLGAEYRFYLAKENKDPAPHGVYLAPFVNFYQFDSDRTLLYTDSTGTQSKNLNTKIGFLSIGGAMGYQFLLGKRFVIDAVLFGPSLTYYNFNSKLDGQITGVSTDEALQKILEAIRDKFPLLEELSSEEGVKRSGVQRFWSVGFRYNISVGFRF